MNINSIEHKTPAGSNDVIRAAGSLELRYAVGSETFTPLGNPTGSDHPVAGEVTNGVPESKVVMGRRWNWRNGYDTRIDEDTRIILNFHARFRYQDHSREVRWTKIQKIETMPASIINRR